MLYDVFVGRFHSVLYIFALFIVLSGFIFPKSDKNAYNRFSALVCIIARIKQKAVKTLVNALYSRNIFATMHILYGKINSVKHI